MKGFHLFLHNRDSRDIYPENNGASFTIRLPNRIKLEKSAWSCGLVECCIEIQTGMYDTIYICCDILGYQYAAGVGLPVLRAYTGSGKRILPVVPPIIIPPIIPPVTTPPVTTPPVTTPPVTTPPVTTPPVVIPAVPPGTTPIVAPGVSPILPPVISPIIPPVVPPKEKPGNSGTAPAGWELWGTDISPPKKSATSQVENIEFLNVIYAPVRITEFETIRLFLRGRDPAKHISAAKIITCVLHFTPQK